MDSAELLDERFSAMMDLTLEIWLTIGKSKILCNPPCPGATKRPLPCPASPVPLSPDEMKPWILISALAGCALSAEPAGLGLSLSASSGIPAGLTKAEWTGPDSE